MRISTVTYDEAYSKAFLRALLLSTKYGIETSIKERSGDCSEFPSPDEFLNWSGETNAICLYNDETNEEVFACAYWE